MDSSHRRTAPAIVDSSRANCPAFGVKSYPKKGERLLPAFLATPAGFVLIAAVALLVISISVILRQLRSIPYTWTKWVTAHLVLNLCSVVFVLIIAEVVIRVFAVDSIEAPIFANTVLRPRSWESVAAQ